VKASPVHALKEGVRLDLLQQQHRPFSLLHRDQQLKPFTMEQPHCAYTNPSLHQTLFDFAFNLVQRWLSRRTCTPLVPSLSSTSHISR
jgi:hypothetical protein